MIQYSIGELIDRLGITNLKIWHTEEEIKEKEKIEPPEDVLVLCDRVVELNKLRNELIKSIDEFFENK
jgi:hypothetical protein